MQADATRDAGFSAPSQFVEYSRIGRNGGGFSISPNAGVVLAVVRVVVENLACKTQADRSRCTRLIEPQLFAAMHTRKYAVDEDPMPTPFGSVVSNLDWNLLRTFLVIVEEKSITKAAERLQIKQPSATAALQRLEAALGCVLITRASRRFEVTKHGEILYQECAQIYRSVARTTEKLTGASRDVTGSVRLVLVTHVQFEAFDRALHDFHIEYPSVTLQVDIASSQDGVRAVQQQIAPIALCLLTKPIVGLDCEHLVREEFGIYCSHQYPLFGQSKITLAELQNESFVGFMCMKGGGSLEPMLALGSNAGFGRRVVGGSIHLEEVKRMVLAGLGIGVLPTESVKDEVKEGILWRFPLPDLALGADLYLVTNPSMLLETAEERFLTTLKRCITDGRRD